MADLVSVLTAQGFVDDAQAKNTAVANAQAQGLSANGAYTVQHVLTRGGVVVTVEQNQAPEDLGGLEALVTHPPLAVVASAKGRVAFNPDDTDLAVRLVAELS